MRIYMFICILTRADDVLNATKAHMAVLLLDVYYSSFGKARATDKSPPRSTFSKVHTPCLTDTRLLTTGKPQPFSARPLFREKLRQTPDILVPNVGLKENDEGPTNIILRPRVLSGPAQVGPVVLRKGHAGNISEGGKIAFRSRSGNAYGRSRQSIR